MAEIKETEATEAFLGCLAGVVGYTYDIIYDLFFTDRRLIAVVIRHPADEQPGPASSSLMSLIFGSWPERRNLQMEQDRVSRERRKAARAASPEELLAQNQLNFALAYVDIKKVKLARSFFESKLVFSLADFALRDTLTYTLKKSQVEEATHILKQVLADKMGD